MGFLRRVQGVELLDKVHRFEMRQPRKVHNTSPYRKIPAALVRPCIAQGRLARQVLMATPAGKQARGPKTRWRDYISDLAWSRLGVDRRDLSEIADDREVFRVDLGMLPPRPSSKGKEHENE